MPKQEKSKKRNRNDLWVTWYNMKQRCTNPTNHCYSRYGGRGIKICDKWLNDFHSFEKWAKESGYKKGLTIDRIDNDKGYSPENCRWVTMNVQQNNRRTNRIETYEGVTDTVANLCRFYGRDYWLVNNRLQKGKNIEEAMSKELCPGGKPRYIEYKGEVHTVSEWTRILGFKRNTLSERLRKGWDVEQAFETPVGGKHV